MLTNYTNCIIIKNEVYEMYINNFMKGCLIMKELNRIRVMLGVDIATIADHLGMSYYKLAKIFKEEEICPSDLKERIKFFLTEIYTKCIESA